MSLTTKTKIRNIMILGYDDEPKIIKELNDLINKMNESQLKELLGYLYISQVSTYQMIYDYAEEIEVI